MSYAFAGPKVPNQMRYSTASTSTVTGQRTDVLDNAKMDVFRTGPVLSVILENSHAAPADLPINGSVSVPVPNTQWVDGAYDFPPKESLVNMALTARDSAPLTTTTSRHPGVQEPGVQGRYLSNTDSLSC